MFLMMQEDAQILMAYLEKQYEKVIAKPGKYRHEYWAKEVQDRSIELWTL